MIPLEILESVYAQANHTHVPYGAPLRISIAIPEKVSRAMFDPFGTVQYYEFVFSGPKPYKIKSIQQPLPFKEMRFENLY